MKWIFALLLVCCSCASRVDVCVRGVSLYATGDEDVVYLVEEAQGTNWVTVSNFIGNGTNAPPEKIVTVPRHKIRTYRFRPE